MVKDYRFSKIEMVSKKYLDLFNKINYNEFGEKKYKDFTEGVNNLIKELEKIKVKKIKYRDNGKLMYGYIVGDEDEFIFIKIGLNKETGKYPYSKVNIIYKETNIKNYNNIEFDIVLGRDKYELKKAPNHLKSIIINSNI